MGQIWSIGLAWLSGKLIQLAMLGFHEDEVGDRIRDIV